MGVPLLPRVSLATDSRVIPLGALTAFAVPLPGDSGVQGRGGLLAGIGLAQDRGGAIKGNRADLFCGAGPWAEHVAGIWTCKGRCSCW
jgi:Membrane-bound lytic murein transglycosylase